MIKKLLAVLLLLSIAACSKVPAGNVGIRVHLLGSDKGVESETLGVGRYWVGWNSELYLFPTFMQNREWSGEESFQFQTMDGMKASAGVGMSYVFEEDKIPTIFATYRRGVDEITDVFLRNMVRDALVKEVSVQPIDYVYGRGKAELMEKVEARVRESLDSTGIQLQDLYWIGDIEVPEIVTEAINTKIQASQLAQQRVNELEQTRAEANKVREAAAGNAEAILIEANAQAEANRKLRESLSTEVILYRAINQWDGVLPTSVFGAPPVPVLSVE